MSERSRRLQARKMSKRRARSGSPPEMTIAKRRSTKACEEFTFCDGVTSPIDTLFTPPPEVRSPIYRMFNTDAVEDIMTTMLENQSDFLDLAKLRMKDIVEGVPFSNEVAKSLLRGVWLKPCFVRALSAAVDDGEMIGEVMIFSNRNSVDDRKAQMEGDPYFKLSVMGLKEPISTNTFLRLFLSILIGHWGDKDLLRLLDEKMGKNVFGLRLNLIARMDAILAKRAGIKDEIESFSFCIEDASHAKDLEPLRELLVERYGQREDIDIEAILEKTKPHISNLLSITQKYLHYDGKKTEIKISVINGHFSALSMKSMPSKEAS